MEITQKREQSEEGITVITRSDILEIQEIAKNEEEEYEQYTKLLARRGVPLTLDGDGFEFNHKDFTIIVTQGDINMTIEWERRKDANESESDSEEQIAN